MLIRRIAGATHNLGAPKNWEPEKDGICSALPVRAEILGEQMTMTSAWEPTPEELARLNAGGLVHLRIVGRSHPPVMLEVGEPPA